MRWAPWLLLSILCCAAPAFASPADEARATALFEKAEGEYQAGRFQAAIDLLLEAQRLAPDAVLHYNLARAYEGMGDLDRALESYRAYVETAPDSKDRGAVEARIKTLEQLRASRASDPDKGAAAEPRGVAPLPEGPAPAAESNPSAAPWIIAGVGALGLGAGGILGGLSLDRGSDAEDPATSGVDALRLQEESSTFATAANVTFIASGVVLGAGLVWGIIDVVSSGDAAPTTSAVRIEPTLGGLVIHGRF